MTLSSAYVAAVDKADAMLERALDFATGKCWMNARGVDESIINRWDRRLTNDLGMAAGLATFFAFAAGSMSHELQPAAEFCATAAVATIAAYAAGFVPTHLQSAYYAAKFGHR